MTIDIVATESMEPFAPYQRFPVLFTIKDNPIVEWILFNTPWCISPKNELPTDTYYLLNNDNISIIVKKIRDLCTYELAYEPVLDPDLDLSNIHLINGVRLTYEYFKWMKKSHTEICNTDLLKQRYEAINMFDYLHQFHTNNLFFNLFVVKQDKIGLP